MQRQYGKTSAELETLVDGFAWALADYSVADVIAAIGQHIRKSPNIPTPSEIVAIIDPPVEPFKPDWAYYNRLRELARDGGPYALSADEIEYIQTCERHSQANMRLANGYEPPKTKEEREKEFWEIRVKGFYQTKIWPRDIGPPPNDPKCQCPPDIIQKFMKSKSTDSMEAA